MKFLLDENILRSAADLIYECGHEAVRFDSVCNSGDAHYSRIPMLKVASS